MSYQPSISVLGKGDKDPNRPKKAMSAYFIFMGDYRNHCKMTGEANTSNVRQVKVWSSILLPCI